MRVFFDCEFTGLHQKTTLISIGCVSDDGKQFYAELDDFDLAQVDGWLQENVTSKLWIQHPEIISSSDVTYSIGNIPDVAQDLSVWLSQWSRVEMWSDVYAYDWMLFCELFGGAFKIPSNVYYIPFDLATLFAIRGIDPDVNREQFADTDLGDALKHNALWDARIIRTCYHKVQALPK